MAQISAALAANQFNYGLRAYYFCAVVGFLWLVLGLIFVWRQCDGGACALSSKSFSF